MTLKLPNEVVLFQNKGWSHDKVFLIYFKSPRNGSLGFPHVRLARNAFIHAYFRAGFMLFWGKRLFYAACTVPSVGGRGVLITAVGYSNFGDVVPTSFI